MSTFFYDSNRTLKIREQLKEEINKVQNLNEAMNLLNEITADFLNIYMIALLQIQTIYKE